MLRHFIQPHPTFGSYKNPVKSKVEASPYYFWWLALTLSDEYNEFCDRAKSGDLTELNERELKMLRVYENFGDVSYEGNRYVAFANWWNTEVGRYESGRKISRGVFLFAEQQTVGVHQIVEPDYAAKLTADDRFIVLAIPKVNDKSLVNNVLELIVNKHFETRKGRDARNPKYSTALFAPSKSTVPDALNKGFSLYLTKRELESRGQRVSNADLPEHAGTKTGGRKDIGADFDAFDRREAMAATVRGQLRKVQQMIDNAAIGVFP